jgi:RNA polymerase sigma-70 factor, ECF subfamily
VSEVEALDFARIHDGYRGRVVAYAAKLIGRDAAEDVAQAVFLKVLRSLDTLADRSRLTSWIFAITLNTVRDVARKSAVRAASAVGPAAASADSSGRSSADPSPDPLAQVPDSVARSPEENLARSEMVACYVDFVNQLPHDQREVYVLSEFGDLANAAIAQQLSLPVSTVKMRLHRARAQLYDMIRRNCRCYQNERGELMAEPAPPPSRSREA